MPAIIDTETMNIDELPGIWSPIQWELGEEERLAELEEQATASLLNTIDIPEAILRLLLGETEIVRAFDPPSGYDPDMQGEWDAEIITFSFKRGIRLYSTERRQDHLQVIYEIEDLGKWVFEIKPESVTIEKI